MAVYEATEKNFDELLNTEYAVVDFYGDHCGPCKMLAPVYNEASNDLAMLRFIKVSTDQCRELAKRFDIHLVPTLLFFRDGRAVHACKGAMDRKTLNEHLAKLLYGGEFYGQDPSK